MTLPGEEPPNCEDIWKKKYIEKMCRGLGQHFNNEQFTDIKVQVENKVFNCHRVILSAMSPYFDAMFASGMRECHNDIITIQDIQSEIFEKILKFIYTGNYILDIDDIDCLLRTSALFQIKCLQERCEEFMLDKVDTDNCIGIWRLASGHGCSQLAQKAYRTILHNFRDVWQSEDFTALDIEEVLDVIKDDDLNVINEELVCEAALKWVNADLNTRKQHLSELFEYLRLPLVQPEYLVEVLEKHSVIDNNPDCTSVIEEAKRYHLLPARRQEFMSPRLAFRNKGEFEEVIVCIGGSYEDQDTTIQVICYSHLSKCWYDLTPLPYNAGVEFATCSYGNAIFISGGSKHMNGMAYYLNTQNTWAVCQPMLLGRRRHAMVAVGDSVYVIGGYDDDDDTSFRTLMSIEQFRISTGSWEDAGYLSIPVRSMSVAVYRQKIYIFGGVKSTDCDTKIVQCFDTHEKVCTVIHELPVFCRLSVALSYRHQIFIVCPNGDVIRFTSDRKADIVGTIPGFERSNFGAILKSGVIYIIGGTDKKQSVDEFLTFDPSNGSATMTGDYLPRRMFGFGCVKTVIHKKYLKHVVNHDHDVFP